MILRPKRFEKFTPGADTIPAKKLNALSDGLNDVFNARYRRGAWKPDYEETAGVHEHPFKVTARVIGGKLVVRRAPGCVWSHSSGAMSSNHYREAEEKTYELPAGTVRLVCIVSFNRGYHYTERDTSDGDTSELSELDLLRYELLRKLDMLENRLNQNIKTAATWDPDYETVVLGTDEEIETVKASITGEEGEFMVRTIEIARVILSGKSVSVEQIRQSDIDLFPV